MTQHTPTPTRDQLVRGMAVVHEAADELLESVDWECVTLEDAIMKLELAVGRLKFLRRHAYEVLEDPGLKTVE